MSPTLRSRAALLLLQDDAGCGNVEELLQQVATMREKITCDEGKMIELKSKAEADQPSLRGSQNDQEAQLAELSH
eukprot:scaffold70381_cov29-Prasinocladus_malaysianus.AAC.1